MAFAIDIMRPVIWARNLAEIVLVLFRADERDSFNFDSLVSVTYKRFSDILKT